MTSCLCVCVHVCVYVCTCVHMLMETSSVGTLKAWAERGASRIWAGMQVGCITGPPLTPGEDARRWGHAKHAKGK